MAGYLSRGPYAREVGSPYSAMGALGDIELQQRKLDALGAGNPYGSIAKEGTLFLKDLVNVFRTPTDEGKAQQHVLDNAAEVMGPELAKEQGIPLDQAKYQISGGVAPPEAPYKRALRAFGLGGDAPAGEAFDDRVAKIRGMAMRLGFQRQQRQAGEQDLMKLLTLAGRVKDPSSLRPYIQEAATRAGYSGLGDIELTKSPGSLWEWAQQQGMSPQEFETMTHPERPVRKSDAQEEEEAYTSGDPARVKWAKSRMMNRMRGRGGGAAADPKMKIYQNLLIEGFKAKRDAIMKDPTLSVDEKNQRITQLMKETDNTLRQLGIGGTTVDAFDQSGGGGAPPDAQAPQPDDSDSFLDSVGVPAPTPPQTTTTTMPPTTTTLPMAGR